MNDAPELFIACLGERAQKKVFGWVNDLRNADIWVEVEYASKSLKAQMKKADRLGARLALIVGDDEIESGKSVLRDMNTKEQREMELDNLVENLKREIEG